MAHDEDDATAPGRGFNRRLLAPMLLGSSLNPINTSVIAVALAPIAAAFGAPVSEAAWLVSSLYVATSVGQPLAGRLVDSFGPRRLYLVGAVLTGLAGVVGVVAPELWVLVVARVVLGLGTCAAYPASMHLIRSEADRTGTTSPTSVLAALMVTSQGVAVLGPALGGVLVDVGGWRTTFAINIVLGVVCLVLGWQRLPRVPAAPALDAAAEHPRVDVLGVVLFTTAVVALLFMLVDPRPVRLWLLALAVAAGAGFGWWERRHAAPFIDVRVFGGNLPLLATFVRTFLAYVVLYAFVYGFTQWLQQGRGLSASVAGLVLLPAFGVGMVLTAITGRRPAVRAKLVAGSIAQIVAAAMLLTMDPHTEMWLLVAVAVVLGIPQGLVSLAHQNALYHQARKDKIGASSGLLRTFQYFGAMVASAAAGLFFGHRATTAGLHELALFMLVAASLLFLGVVFDRSLARVGRSDQS